MSNQWFRHYSGMMRDAKLVSAAVKSKQSVERVLWVWGAILESANEEQRNGKFSLDPAEAAYFLRCEDADISDILGALEALGRINKGVVVQWSDRQFESDSSKERTAKYRQRKAGAGVYAKIKSHDRNSDGDVTTCDGVVTPPDTDTDTDTDTESKSAKALSATACQEAVSEWNAMADMVRLPRVQNLTEKRLKHLKARLIDGGGIVGWLALTAKIKESPYLLGNNKSGWKCSFDFATSQSGFTKILEGNYDGSAISKQTITQSRHPSVAETLAAFDARLDEAERELDAQGTGHG